MKQRNPVFDNLRGLCMLGVIGIHVGSMAVEELVASPLLVLITNVLSRYSVPAFFFISGYGLFYTNPLEQDLDYGLFVRKRLKSIAFPYVLASLIYIAYNAFFALDWSMLAPDEVLFALFFGTGEYHIYFLVLLLWFYLLFPLWRLLMKAMERIGLKLALPILFAAQVALYQFSFHFWVYPKWIAASPTLRNLCNYRLNYFCFFYLFIFMLGGIIARHYSAFERLIMEHRKALTAFFLLSAGTNTFIFYRWTFLWGMPYENTINYLQQLSLPGLVYTIASCLCFSSILATGQYPFKTALKRMSDRSFIIYLIHPFFIDQFSLFLKKRLGTLEGFSMPLFYCLILGVSYFLAEAWHYYKAKRRVKR